MIQQVGTARWALALWMTVCCGVLQAAEADAAAAVQRGRALYLAQCSMCHQVTGAGVPGTYPPLAGSDFLRDHRRDSILALLEGLERPITVNGRGYHGRMPPVVLTDAQVADVMTFVLNSWKNPGGQVVAEEVAGLRAKCRFPTYEALAAANAYRPLPKAPEGFRLREVARLTDFATRLASDGRGGPVYALGQEGAVWRVDAAAQKLVPVLLPGEYPDTAPGGFGTLGFTLDAERRLWITMNQRVEGGPLVSNVVSIYRTSPLGVAAKPAKPALWYRTAYPYGIGPYNHGISDIRFGPDGLLYVSSGSRTDGGETGTDPSLGSMGETDLTATIWRLDPKSDAPSIEVIARGIRNAYSLGWDGAGTLFTVSNGPDAHAGEEMDVLVPPGPGSGGAVRHHGFPHQLGLAPAATRWYPHTPPAPAGVDFVLPVANLGPDGWRGTLPGSTFDPHSSPAGLVWLDGSFPESVRNSFAVGRFGNLIGTGSGEDSGFDVLSVRPERRADGTWAARVNTLLSPLARPIDVARVAPGTLYVLEYTRPASFKDQVGWLPGRILELAVLR
ncbi:MAG: c-type cytochrome [Verrucomicrobia bacterium]|nr:c-type cytochrome [Verrucomicrobiota bacterium]